MTAIEPDRFPAGPKPPSMEEKNPTTRLYLSIQRAIEHFRTTQRREPIDLHLNPRDWKDFKRVLDAPDATRLQGVFVRPNANIKLGRFAIS